MSIASHLRIVVLPVLVAGLGVCLPASAVGQAASVARVQDLDGASSVPILRAGSQADVRKDDRLQESDVLEVPFNVEVKLEIRRDDAPELDGIIVMSSELLRRGNRGVIKTRGLRSSQDGSYELRRTSDRVVVEIRRGALVQEWKEGPVCIVLAGAEGCVTGTQVAYVARDDTTGFVYVKEGSVDLRQSDGTVVPILPGHFVTLRSGRITTPDGKPEEARGEERRELDEAVDYHRDILWSAPWWKLWRHPWGVVALSPLLLLLGGNDSQTVDVGATLPF